MSLSCCLSTLAHLSQKERGFRNGKLYYNGHEDIPSSIQSVGTQWSGAQECCSDSKQPYHASKRRKNKVFFLDDDLRCCKDLGNVMSFAGRLISLGLVLV